jgi:hypothetical protein
MSSGAQKVELYGEMRSAGRDGTGHNLRWRIRTTESRTSPVGTFLTSSRTGWPERPRSDEDRLSQHIALSAAPTLGRGFFLRPHELLDIELLYTNYKRTTETDLGQ